MTDARALLERHKPRLVYDSHGAVLRRLGRDLDGLAARTCCSRADGTVLAKPPKLRARLPRPARLRRQAPVLAGDAIGETTRDYAAHAAALHRAGAATRDRVYGHARRDRSGRLWLQYWLFYYYNDFQLLGPLLSGGKHEGDWELVQIRLGAERAARAGRLHASTSTPRASPWTDVRKAGASTPLVYVARGSHANYFGAGSHWTGVLVRPAPTARARRSRRRSRCVEDAHAGLGACGPAGGGTRRRRARRWTRPARAARAAARTGSTRRRWSRRRAGWRAAHGRRRRPPRTAVERPPRGRPA